MSQLEWLYLDSRKKWIRSGVPLLALRSNNIQHTDGTIRIRMQPSRRPCFGSTTLVY